MNIKSERCIFSDRGPPCSAIPLSQAEGAYSFWVRYSCCGLSPDEDHMRAWMSLNVDSGCNSYSSLSVLACTKAVQLLQSWASTESLLPQISSLGQQEISRSCYPAVCWSALSLHTKHYSVVSHLFPPFYFLSSWKSLISIMTLYNRSRVCGNVHRCLWVGDMNEWRMVSGDNSIWYISCYRRCNVFSNSMESIEW